MPEDRVDLPAPGAYPRGADRRRADRRAQPRVQQRDRRRRDRRRAAAGGLLLTGLSLAGALHHGRGGARTSEPTAAASVEQAPPAAAGPSPSPDRPSEAPGPFDDIIQAAAKKYGVNPD